LDPNKNYAPLAANILIGLGWFSLLGLNFTGILLILLGSSIKQRDSVARKVAMWLLGLYIVLLLGILVMVTQFGMLGMVPGSMLFIYFAIMLMPVVVPFVLLASSGTRRAYEQFALARATVPCDNCQYNLRGVTTGICPGCEAPFDLDRLKPFESAAPFCENCWYSLKGLSEPRCPECGTPFDLDLLQTYDGRDHEST
jgi:uncharacterized paraquat-inducible protein A